MSCERLTKGVRNPGEPILLAADMSGYKATKEDGLGEQGAWCGGLTASLTFVFSDEECF